MAAAARRRRLGRPPVAISAAASALLPVRSTSRARTRESVPHQPTPIGRRRASSHGGLVQSFRMGANAEDLEHRRLVGLRLLEADGPTTTRRRFDRRKEKMASISGVIPFGQAEIHVGYDRSESVPYAAVCVSRSAEGCGRAVQGATFQYNLSKRTAMYTTVRGSTNKDGPAITLARAHAGPTESGGDSQGLRNRPSSLLLIARSPSASCHRATSKAAFGRPFSCPPRRGAAGRARAVLCHWLPRSGHSPLTRGVRFALILALSMLAFVLRRLVQAVLVMLTVAFIAFMLFQYVGDPVTNILGQDATPAAAPAAAQRPRPRPAVSGPVRALRRQRGPGRVRPEPAPGAQGLVADRRAAAGDARALAPGGADRARVRHPDGRLCRAASGAPSCRRR